MKTKVNLMTAFLAQFFHVISGLIIPRLIITSFGSEVNGLVSSITQFLGFISILEGGIGAVVLSSLYKPIEDRDKTKVLSILNACDSFFRKLSVIFLIYTTLLAVIYPWIIKQLENYYYISILVLVLSFSTVSQYLFAITNKLFLQSDQKIYVVNIVTSITIVLNIVFTFISVNLFDDIIYVKLISSIGFLIQPILYSTYIRKHYGNQDRKKITALPIKDRWSGFAQNLAHFINMNTDIVLITIFLSLEEVSVYSVYLLAFNALKQIISTIVNSYQSNLGKYIASGDEDKLRKRFYSFNGIILILSSCLFSVCLQLVNSFTAIYTSGVNDANYFMPTFAITMTFAQYIYCIREPYRILVLSGGRFRETNFGAVGEAVINLSVSLILIKPFGLTGVAIGTLFAIVFRYIYFLVYLKKDILFVNNKIILINIAYIIILWIINSLLYFYANVTTNSVLGFCLMGVMFSVVALLGSIILYAPVNKIIFGKFIPTIKI